MWTITIIFPRSDTQYLVLVQCLHYSQIPQRKSQMFWRNVFVALNTAKRLHATEVRQALNRTCKFIARQKKQRSAVECRFEESSRTEMGLSLKPIEITTCHCFQCVYFTDKGFISNVDFLIIKLFSSRQELLCHQILANQLAQGLLEMTPWVTIDVIKWRGLEIGMLWLAYC